MEDPERTTLAFDVRASLIFDLRGRAALAAVREEASDPFGDWSDAVERGREPPSWRVRDFVESCGASGLIDPSRSAPGQWHLVLFKWNVEGAPTVIGLD